MDKNNQLIIEENQSESEPKSIWLKIAKVCLYVLFFLLPLFFLPWTIAPVEINKQFLATFLLLVAFLCCLIYFLENKKIVYLKSLLALAVLILLIVVGISTAFSKNPSVSLWDSVQPDSLINFALYGLAFYLAAVLIGQTTQRERIWLRRIWLISLALVVVFGLPQILGKFILPWDFSRQLGFNTIGGVLSWGIFITFGLVVMVGLWDSLDKTARIKKFIFGFFGLLLGLLIIIGLIILNNQLLWLSLALIMIVMVAYKFAIKSKLGLPLIILIVALSFFLLSQSLPILMPLPIEIRPTLSSTFEVAKQTILGKRILFGSGPATFGYDWSLFFGQVRFNQGFSFITTALATLGIFGILAILFLIFSFIKTAIGQIGQLSPIGQTGQIGIFGGVAFFIISYFFHPPFFTQMIFTFLGLGLISSLPSTLKEISLAELSRRKSLVAFIALIFFLSASVALLALMSQKYIAAIYYGKGIQSSQEGDLSQTLTFLDKAARLDPKSDQYQRSLSQVLLLQVKTLIQQNPNINLQDKEGLQIINNLAASLGAGRLATEINPIDSLNWDSLGNIYENLIPLANGADDFAIESYKKAMELDPKNPQEPVNLARTLLISAQRTRALNPQQESWEDKINEAKQTLEKSLALFPNYQPAIFLENQITQIESSTVSPPAATSSAPRHKIKK